jgi:hypothetical protein
MAHWQGDGAWISNATYYGDGAPLPALDGLTGGLVILGLVAWAVYAFRLRNPALWLVPVSILIMLLPTAMTLAYTIENPSYTRASGAIPGVFLLAALPLGMLCWRVAQVPAPRRFAPLTVVLGMVLLAGVVLNGAQPNWDNFYTKYRLHYAYSWKPYTEIARPLHDFAQGEGSYGNAFMVAYPHWLDHRILGTMAGDIRWPNGLFTVQEVFSVIARNANTPYEYDPTRPLFFMVHVDDAAAGEWLEAEFPGGTTEVYTYRYVTDHGEMEGSYRIYRVWAGFIQ